MPQEHRTPQLACGHGCPSRRQFVQAGGVATAMLLLGKVFPGRVRAQDAGRTVRVSRYPKVPLAKLSELKTDEPVDISFPAGAPHADAVLVKLGTRAGGGIGPDQDVVAFNAICTHMGADLSGDYNARHKILGPCYEHLATFDLTRHGMIVAGHATEALPQIVLALEDDQIYAEGIVGLIFGHATNPPASQEGPIS